MRMGDACAISIILAYSCLPVQGPKAQAGEIQIIELPKGTDQLINPHTVLIQNAGGQEIKFHLRSDIETPKLQTLAKDEARLFSDGASTRYVIEVATERQGLVRYVLHGSRRYQIYWNGDQWDVMELVPK